MRHWLMKSEPDVFSIAHLKASKRTGWEGVRNYQARNYMREMRVDDLVLFYHSNSDPSGLAGIARVCREAYPDPTQYDRKSEYYDAKSSADNPRWSQVEVEFVEAFHSVLPLGSLREVPALAKLPLVQKGTRLSVMPVSPSEWRAILALARGPALAPREKS